MPWPEDSVEIWVKGILIIAGVFVGLLILPVVIFWYFMYLILKFFWNVKEEREREKFNAETREAMEQMAEIERQKKEVEQKKKEELLRQQQANRTAIEQESGPEEDDEDGGKIEENEEDEAPGKEISPGSIDFSKSLYLERELNKEQIEALYANGYKRLKISPDGKSGASYYWLRKRFNESKEHAFFCYLIASELKKRGINEITTNITAGPDIEFKFKHKRYCFEVETGSNLVRDSVYVFKKFAFNREQFDKCFVFVTNKKFKYQYSKVAELVTRATLKQTIARLGRDR